MIQQIFGIAGDLLLVGLIFYGFRQGLKVTPDDRQDRSGDSGAI